MRQRPQDLSSPTVNTPSAAPVGTFAPKGTGLGGFAPTTFPTIDFGSLSRSYQQLTDERREFNTSELQAAGRRAANLRNEGMSEEEILRTVTESEETPRNIASKLAKMAKNGTIDEVDNPYFLMGLEGRRAEFVAAQYLQSGQDRVEALAAEISLLPVGEKEDAAIVAALGDLRTDNQEDLGTLGVFGARAIEPLLEDANQQFVDGVRARAKKLRLVEYEEKTGVVLATMARGWPEADSTGRLAIAKNIGAEFANVKLHGKIDAKRFFEDKIIGAGKEIARTDGWGEAGEFIEDMMLNAKTPSGAAVFNASDSVALLDALHIAENRASTETDDKIRKIGQQRSEARASLASGAAFGLLYEAAKESPQAVSVAAANILEAVKEGGPALEKLGITEEQAPFVASWLSDAEQSMIRSSGIFSAIDTQTKRRQVLNLAFAESPEAALASLEAAELPPEERLSLQKELKKMTDTGATQNWNSILQQGAPGKIARAVQDHLGSDALPAEVDRYVAEATSELMDIMQNGGYSSENPLDPVAAHRLTTDFVTGYRERHPAADTPERFLPEGGADAAGVKQAKKTASTLEDFSSRFNGESSATLGGIDRETAPEAVLDAESAMRKRFTDGDHRRSSYQADDTLGKNRMVRSIEAITSEEDLTDTQKNRAVTEILFRSGALNATDLAGSSEDLKEALKKKLEDGSARLSWFGGATSLEDQIEALSTFDTSALNPFTVPLRDLAQYTDIVVHDKVDDDKIVWGPSRSKIDHALEGITNLLEASGLTANDETLRHFFAAQQLINK